MTPAQSLTDVIQPTSLAAVSSLSARLMPSTAVSRWMSWGKKKDEGGKNQKLEFNSKPGVLTGYYCCSVEDAKNKKDAFKMYIDILQHL